MSVSKSLPACPAAIVEVSMNNRWNKIIAYMTAFVMFVSISMLVSCSSAPEQTDVPKESTEHENNENLIIPAFNPIYYYDGLLYYIKQPLGTPALLYYIDPETGESGILCGKPDCTHDSENCNAYLDTTGDGLTVYQDKIYWLSRSIVDRKLYCMKLDGTNRKEVMTLDKECEWFIANKPFIEIYDDTMYRCGSGSEVKDGEPVQKMLLYAQPLQKDSRPETIFTADNIYRVVARLHGNKIYFATVGNDYDLTIYECNLNSGEVQELYHKDEIDNIPADIVVTDNKLILHGVGPCVSIYSLEEGDYTVVGEEGKNYSWATGSKIYEFVNKWEYRLYKLNGELITEGRVNLPEFEDENFTTRYLGSVNETMLILYSASFASEKMPGVAALHNYIAAFDTETLEWRILWDGVSDYE